MHVEHQSDVQQDGTFIHKDVEVGGKPYCDKALEQGVQKGLRKGDPGELGVQHYPDATANPPLQHPTTPTLKTSRGSMSR